MGFAPTVANDGVAAVLLRAATEVHTAEEVTDGSELEELASHLYDSPGGVTASGGVVLGEAVGTEGEAALVARMAAEAVASGVPAERVAIVFPQLTARVADSPRCACGRGPCSGLRLFTASGGEPVRSRARRPGVTCRGWRGAHSGARVPAGTVQRCAAQRGHQARSVVEAVARRDRCSPGTPGHGRSVRADKTHRQAGAGGRKRGPHRRQRFEMARIGR